MRRGFHAIELAIILIILIVLAALIFTAVPKMHGVSARVACRNYLKQHGYAIHSYHDTHQHYPPGTMPNPDLAPEQRFSFHAALLPFVEQEKLYYLLAKSEAWDSDRNGGLLAHRTFKLYQCPAWIEFHGADANLTASGHLAFAHYVGVAGVGADAAARPTAAPGVGMFGYDRTPNAKDVKDGLANTLLLIETTRDVGPWARGGPGTVRAVGVDNTQFGGTHFRRAWTYEKRADGFHVLLADGGVRHTKPDIASDVLAGLATIAGGEEVPANW
jgi:hypothetical protein